MHNALEEIQVLRDPPGAVVVIFGRDRREVLTPFERMLFAHMLDEDIIDDGDDGRDAKACDFGRRVYGECKPHDRNVKCMHRRILHQSLNKLLLFNFLIAQRDLAAKKMLIPHTAGASGNTVCRAEKD